MKRAEFQSRVVLLAAPILMLAGCAGDAEVEDAELGAGMEEVAVAEDIPRVEIVQPADGATVTGPSVQVVLATHGAVVEPADSRQTPGRGHHHIFIDEDPTLPTEPIPPTSETIVHMGTGAEEYTIENLAPGPHRIIAVFAYGDHVPMQEVAQDTVEFTVTAP